MRNFIFSLFTVFASLLQAAEILVKPMAPIPSGQSIVLQLYDRADAFGDIRDPLRVQRFEAPGPGGTFSLTNVPPGRYALMVFLDENANGRMDKNFLGIPREPMGFSQGYRPKGPPSFERASFVLESEEDQLRFDIPLERPLGKRGRVGVGMAVLARSSPYRDYRGGVYQPIPVLTYTGKRVILYGPGLKVGLWNGPDTRLAFNGRYSMGVYDPEDSPFLEGMRDREDTFMAGLSLTQELPAGFKASLEYQHDVLDRIGGGLADFRLSRGFAWKSLRLTPQVGLRWTSSDQAQHAFGVELDEARPGRPAYRVGEMLSPVAGLSCFLELQRDWQLFVQAGVEGLPDKVTDSPLVEKDYVFSGFAGLNYLF